MESRALSSVFEFVPTDTATVFANIMTSLPKGALEGAPSFKLHDSSYKTEQTQKPANSSSPMLSLAESLLDCGETRQQFFQVPKKDANTMRTVELNVSLDTSDASSEDASCGEMLDLGDLLTGGNSSALGSPKISAAVSSKKVLDIVAEEPAAPATAEEAPAARKPSYLEMIAPDALLEENRNIGIAPVRHALDANEQRLALKKMKRREQNREAQRRHRMRTKVGPKDGQ